MAGKDQVVFARREDETLIADELEARPNYCAVAITLVPASVLIPHHCLGAGSFDADHRPDSESVRLDCPFNASG